MHGICQHMCHQFNKYRSIIINIPTGEKLSFVTTLPIIPYIYLARRWFSLEVVLLLVFSLVRFSLLELVACPRDNSKPQAISRSGLGGRIGC